MLSQAIGLIAFCQINVILATQNRQVRTQLGLIEGTVQKTYTGKSFFQFEGVPYAAPPVGILRYEVPQLPQKWEGVLNASTPRKCIQYSQKEKRSDGTYPVVGTEDCLYYNVYTPTLNQSASLDVVIHLHGGAFMFGSGSGWRPDIIMNRDVVYVSINYRLGPMGFLSTQDEVLPGNLGLRDQQLAIRQIKANIKYFGGNPNHITLHGLSSGSASVHFHTILPGSKGLFQRAIAESGCALNNWVLMDKPMEKTKRMALLVGCPTHNSSVIKSCLKTKPAELIVQNVKKFQPFLYNPFTPWAVVVDGRWSSSPVLPDHPMRLLIKKEIYDVPLLMSHVSSEGLYPGAEFYSKKEYLETINAKWDKVLPDILKYEYTVDREHMDEVSQAIREKYLKNRALNYETFQDLIQAIGDRSFVADIEKGLKLHSAGIKSPVYAYLFNYRAEHSSSESFAKTNKNLGTAHGDDTSLILRQTGMPALSRREDIKVSNLLLDIIMSFIKQGHPKINAPWKPVSKNVHDHLNILKINKHDDLVLLRKVHIGERPFWDSLPFKENEKLLNITLNF